jgi:hypothetical protein
LKIQQPPNGKTHKLLMAWRKAILKKSAAGNGQQRGCWAEYPPNLTQLKVGLGF